MSGDGRKVERRKNDDPDELFRFKQRLTAADKNRKRLESEYGSRIAAQLDVADPRKDLIRQQGSRFKDVVEQERSAKLHRRLAELEAQDAIAEKMEALTSITVQAWRCVQCSLTTESHRAKALCEEEGHVVNSVSVQKTHWECGNCSLSVYVLDRELPHSCGRCNAVQWKQIPLRRVAKVAMDRDLLLPRGEELPFLNSLPGARTFKPVREPTDDYEGL
jgi:ribosomal protein S27AE